MTENIDLKFASEPLSRLTLAYKWNKLGATVRYEDEKNIQEGDRLNIISAYGEKKMGEADVEHTEMVEVRRALDVINGWHAEYSINTREYLVSRLHDFYGGPMSLTTTVKVIILNPDMNVEEEE